MPATRSAARSFARVAAGVTATGLGLLGYTLLEARMPVLRRVEVPLLAADEHPLTILHLSDLHLTNRTEARVAWVRGLAALRPDVVVDTGAGTLHADLRQPLRGLAAGQSVVVYGGDGGRRVLAQATIA